MGSFVRPIPPLIAVLQSPGAVIGDTFAHIFVIAVPALDSNTIPILRAFATVWEYVGARRPRSVRRYKTQLSCFGRHLGICWCAPAPLCSEILNPALVGWAPFGDLLSRGGPVLLGYTKLIYSSDDHTSVSQSEV